MKKLAISIALVFSLTATLFANDNKPSITGDSTTTALSSEEIALEEELAAELEINVEAAINELMSVKEVTAIKVFDFSGNEVLSQSENIDYSVIPANAALVMSEDGTEYYMISE